jgi:hypothetical protein
MSELASVYFCDGCKRVVAEVQQNGTLLIRSRHGKDTHETRLGPFQIKSKEIREVNNEHINQDDS